MEHRYNNYLVLFLLLQNWDGKCVVDNLKKAKSRIKVIRGFIVNVLIYIY